MRLLEDRLWIPNRVGEEFYDNRTSVIRERQGVRDAILEEVAAPVEALVTVATTQARRHGFAPDAAEAAVREAVLAAFDPVIGDVEGTVGGVTIDPDAHPDSDLILTQICELFDNKIGPAFNEKQSAAAQKAHSLRLAGRIPPGYLDEKKAESAIGDYLVWKQTMDHATDRQLPVLLITNEKKADWVFRDGGYTMPRVELVREMKRQAACDFHLVDVRTFLELAKKHLAAHISDAAVDEAARVSNEVAEEAPRWKGNRRRVALAALADNYEPGSLATLANILSISGYGNPAAFLQAANLAALIYKARYGNEPTNQ